MFARRIIEILILKAPNVDITGTIPANVLLTAYKGTNGTVIVVAINKNTSQVAPYR